MNFKQKLLAYSAVAGVVASVAGSATAADIQLKYEKMPISNPIIKQIWEGRAAAAIGFADETIAPRALLAKVTLHDGRVFYVSQLQASNECGINNCPLRIMQNGEVTQDIMACDANETHTVNESGSILFTCEDTNPTGIK